MTKMSLNIGDIVVTWNCFCAVKEHGDWLDIPDGDVMMYLCETTMKDDSGRSHPAVGFLHSVHGYLVTWPEELVAIRSGIDHIERAY